MIKIIFVCLGNICRSPLAEAICQKKINERGWGSQVKCDSAGTAAYHIGENPDHRSIKVATDHGVPISHRGQQFTSELAKHFDYWLAMDTSNYSDMKSVLGGEQENLYLMRHFDDVQPEGEVPDPYYGGKDGFERVYEILDRSIENFLEFIKEKHSDVL